MIQEKSQGGPPDGRAPAEALDPSADKPQKLLEPGKPRLAIEAGNKRRHRLWGWIIGGLVILLVYLIVHSFNSAGNAPRGKSAAQAGTAITTGQTTTGDIPIYIEALGTVTPLNTVTVYSQITGQVIAVHYHEGQMVKKGDPLIDVDPRPYEATLTQAEGNLAHDQGLLAEATTAIKPHSRKMQSPASSTKTSNRSWYRTKARSNPTKAPYLTTRHSSRIATSSHRSPAASACGWWIRAIPSSRAAIPRWW
jgi:hypothetical protein